jgi:type IX secretion system PorP/SprF family membrane protein
MKTNRIYHLIVGVCISAFGAQAQQLPQYSQYMLNNYAINPAVAGSNDYYEGKSNNRYQWKGITDSPRTYILSLNGPTKNQKVGLGGTIFTDITGPTRRTGLSLTYAYHLKLNEQWKLGMGLSAGLLEFAVDGSKIRLRDEGDNSISSGLQSVIVPDFGFGLYAYSKKIYIGISAPQIAQNHLVFFDYQTATLSKLEDHYFIHGGYKWDLNEDFRLEPGFLIKYVKPAPVQFDVGAKLIYKEQFWLGANFRTRDAASVMAGFVYNDYLSFAYAYDITTSKLKDYSGGTHEIMLGIKFFAKKEGKSTAAMLK